MVLDSGSDLEAGERAAKHRLEHKVPPPGNYRGARSCATTPATRQTEFAAKTPTADGPGHRL